MDSSALLAAAVAHGLDPLELDELVLDCVHRSASARFNAGEPAGLSDVEAFDAVHDDADALASQVNAGGLASQVPFLVAELGAGPLAVELRHLGVPLPRA